MIPPSPLSRFDSHIRPFDHFSRHVFMTISEAWKSCHTECEETRASFKRKDCVKETVYYLD